MQIRRSIIALSVLLAAGLPACGSDDDGAQGTAGEGSEPGAQGTAGEGGELGGKIAVLLPDSASSSRWETADRPFFEEAFKASGLEEGDYIISNAEGDAANQRNQAEQAITEGATVLLLVNLDSGSGAAIIDAAQDQDVKVIDYDRLTLDGTADYYVSGDATEAGRLQGQGIVDDLQGVEMPGIAILDGAPTDSFATDLQTGYMEVLKPKFDSGEYKKVAQQAVPDWDGQQALTIFEQMLQKADNKIDAVVAANDTLANAAISALLSRGLPPIPTSGLDATTQALQHILAGEQTFTVYFAIKEQARLAADLAVALARGEEPEGVDATVDSGAKEVPTILLQPMTIRADNIESTVIADGFASWDDICVGKYEQYCPKDR